MSPTVLWQLSHTRNIKTAFVLAFARVAGSYSATLSSINIPNQTHESELLTLSLFLAQRAQAPMSLTSRAAALASGDKALLRPRPGLGSPASTVSTGAAGGIRLPFGSRGLLR